jgi:hypothetical protein
LASDAEGVGFPAGVVGGVEAIANAAQELSRRGLSPEPARDLVAAGRGPRQAIEPWHRAVDLI